jgi:hypothetical protein
MLCLESPNASDHLVSSESPPPAGFAIYGLTNGVNAFSSTSFA